MQKIKNIPTVPFHIFKYQVLNQISSIINISPHCLSPFFVWTFFSNVNTGETHSVQNLGEIIDRIPIH